MSEQARVGQDDPRGTASPAAHDLRPFAPRPEWFILDAGGLHGIPHEARVLVWTQVFARAVRDEGLTVDANVLGWAASLHDVRRRDDGEDRHHGRRAAQWLRGNPDILPAGTALARVSYLCEWHVPNDDEAPALTDELKVFKDADALDRWRIGGPNPALLRTQAARALLDASCALVDATARVWDGATAFDEVVRAAVKLGFLAASATDAARPR